MWLALLVLGFILLAAAQLMLGSDSPYGTGDDQDDTCVWRDREHDANIIVGPINTSPLSRTLLLFESF